MGKKSKVNKLARMSDEERARYLQQRADMEEEASRRKRELIARFIKNKLDKEEAYSRINTAKINQGWRFILRKIKCEQMATDIKAMMNSFNFVVEKKERQVEFLTNAIADADGQHRRAFQAHNETLTYFISVGKQRLTKIHDEFENRKNDCLENWEKDETNLSESQNKAEFKLKLIMFIMNRNFQKHMAEKELQGAVAKNDLRIEFEEDMRSLWKPKQLEIENIWAQLRNIYNRYLEEHSPIMGHYYSLREKDDFYQRDIAKNEVMIQQATELIKNLQTELINTTNRMAKKLSRMNRHKEQLTAKYWQMKKDDKIERSKADQKLVFMVNCSQDIIKRMENVSQKLFKIVQLAEICRKYETEEDLLIYTETSEKSETPVEYENLDEEMAEECREYQKLEKFMIKMNNARVQILCLKAEKVKLAKENEKIKQYIKKYLTEMALANGDKRPQSMRMHSRIQKIDGGGKILNRPVTCIEGATSIAVMHEKRLKVERRNREKAEIRAFPRVQCWMKAS